MNNIKQLTSRLFHPVDIAPLVFFRIVFGALMLWEVWRYFYHTRITRYYVDTTFVFHYLGFGWLSPLPGNGMYYLFYFLGLLSVLIMLGLFYRVSMAAFWLCFTYIYLLDKAQYLNHFYLVSLVSFLLIFVPAHRALSIDALLRPKIGAQAVPAWSLWVLRGQMGVVYVFGGLAKLNADWLAGEPMRDWLADRTDFPLIGGLFTEEWLVYLFSYGGLLLDLFIVPALLWRRTRIPALALATLFHLMNARLFNIGIFPWFAIAATLIFMPPTWFRPWRTGPVAISTAGNSIARRGWLLAAIGVYFAVQVVIPLRHWLYPGNPSWTEEGHTLSWRMRLRDKGGTIAFYATDPHTGQSWVLNADGYLSSRQFSQMLDNPDMILRFAHYLAGPLNNAHPDVRLQVRSNISLNSRAPQLLIDPTVDLIRETDDLLIADWILPLVQRPYPNEPVPGLLLSRRHAGVMMLINVTDAPYPLDGLTVQAEGDMLRGTDFGVDVLGAGECLMAHTADADLHAVFAPCNEAGARVTLPAALLNDVVDVDTGAAAGVCRGPSCVITPAGGPHVDRR